MLSKAISPHSLTNFLPTGAEPLFIHPAHGGDNYCRPDSCDIAREQLLPDLPKAAEAHRAQAWSQWSNWQLAVALLPERDTVNGELFDLNDIQPCVGTCSTKRLSSHVQNLYPNWEGRYRFMLKHVLCVIKRYLRDGGKRHSREELIRLAQEKFFPAQT